MPNRTNTPKCYTKWLRHWALGYTYIVDDGPEGNRPMSGYRNQMLHNSGGKDSNDTIK